MKTFQIIIIFFSAVLLSSCSDRISKNSFENLNNYILENVNLSLEDFSGSYMLNASISSSDINETNFESGNFLGSSIDNSTLKDNNFSKTSFIYSTLYR